MRRAGRCCGCRMRQPQQRQKIDNECVAYFRVSPMGVGPKQRRGGKS
jgi:hypothetical protein